MATVAAVRGSGAGGREPPRAGVGRWLPVTFGVATVGAQIAYPLVPGGVLTRVIVALFFAASVSHSLVWRGTRFTVWLVAVTAGGGLAVEAIGVATGVPFGSYAYADTLAPTILGVPWVIPLAWTMMAYPALLVGRRISDSPVGGTLVAGAALAAWDLYLDPQMVAAGHWSFQDSGPAILGIPLLNYAGWFATAALMMAVLRRVLPDRPADDRLPIALYVWTWAGSLVAHAVFLGLPGSALLGGLGMGAVVLALLRRA